MDMETRPAAGAGVRLSGGAGGGTVGRYRAACGQSALERAESLLVSRECRGHPPVAVVLQSGSVEHVETYGAFTPCSAGSLTGKMGTCPPLPTFPSPASPAKRTT